MLHHRIAMASSMRHYSIRLAVKAIFISPYNIHHACLPSWCRLYGDAALATVPKESQVIVPTDSPTSVSNTSHNNENGIRSNLRPKVVTDKRKRRPKKVRFIRSSVFENQTKGQSVTGFVDEFKFKIESGFQRNDEKEIGKNNKDEIWNVLKRKNRTSTIEKRIGTEGKRRINKNKIIVVEGKEKDSLYVTEKSSGTARTTGSINEKKSNTSTEEKFSAIGRRKRKRTKKPDEMQEEKEVVGLETWTEITSDKKPEYVDPGPQGPIATLAHGLDRVLFNPGIHWLQDPRSQVYNFDPYLENIIQPDEFDYDALPPYIRPSAHNRLQKIALDLGKKYMGSTSSMSTFMSHFYFLISNWRPINTNQLSAVFKDQPKTYTSASKAPGSVRLVKNENGLYSIDAGKVGPEETILSLLGRSMEKMLTLPPEQVESYRKQNSWQVSQEERTRPETYYYSQFGDILMRSQLDCVDQRLPKHTFDVKTRAVIAIRLDQRNYEDNSGYELRRAHGLLESFEREYYDMTRSAFLKYSMQVRIGNMDGIIVAYHNTQRIFGFQYVSLGELDERLFGSSEMGEQSFSLILKLLNTTLDRLVQEFPEKSLSLDFETETSGDAMIIYVEPYDKQDTEYETNRARRLNEMLDEIIQQRQEKEKQGNETSIASVKEEKSTRNPHPNIAKVTISVASFLNGSLVKGPVYFPTNENPDNPTKWTIKYDIKVEKSLDMTPNQAVAMETSMWQMRKKALKLTSMEDLVLDRTAFHEERAKLVEDTAETAQTSENKEVVTKNKPEPKGLKKLLREISMRHRQEEELNPRGKDKKIVWTPKLTHIGSSDGELSTRDEPTNDDEPKV